MNYELCYGELFEFHDAGVAHLEPYTNFSGQLDFHVSWHNPGDIIMICGSHTKLDCVTVISKFGVHSLSYKMIREKMIRVSEDV